jgi:hypothetical protein
MAVEALLTAFAYVDEWDATAHSDDLAAQASQPPLVGTTFRDVATNGPWEVVGASGMKKGSVRFSGFWSAAATAAVDAQAFDHLAVANRVITVGRQETEGEPCFMLKAGHFSYEAFGKLGELAPFTLDASVTDAVGLVRGYLAKKMGSVAATGALGTYKQLGAVSATQYAYATLHLFGTAGTTITVVLESDDNAGFSSATTRATFGPLTTTGGTWATRAAGAITDTYWRLRVSAITGTWTVAGAIAIQ